MCGRFALGIPRKQLADEFQALDALPESAALERFNVAPGAYAPVEVEGNGDRRLEYLRWGLIPHWAKDEKIGWKTINARAETVASKSAFSAAFKRRRCLVPVSGFYEWQPLADGKQPWFFRLHTGQTMALAGLWERWTPPEAADSQPLLTFTILTTQANELLAPVHDRMPVVIQPDDYAIWLGEAPGAPTAMLRPLPPEDMEGWPVSRAVNRPKADGAQLIQPIDENRDAR